MKEMKHVQMYECQHCKKLFKTPDKHNCRRDPDKTNCYSCKNWGHQFYFGETEYWSATCSQEASCAKHETSYAEEAHELMRFNGWCLNCPEYKAK